MKIDLDSGIEGAWAKVGKDIKDGDRVKILDAGQIQPSGFKDEQGHSKDQYVFKVLTSKREQFNVAFNRTSRNTLGRGYGTETEEWVNKVAKCFVVKQMVGDGLKNVLYLAPDGWEMTDDGEFIDPNAEQEPAPQRAIKTAPPIEYPKEDISPDDIPF